MKEEILNDNEAQVGFLNQKPSGLIIVFIQKELLVPDFPEATLRRISNGGL